MKNSRSLTAAAIALLTCIAADAIAQNQACTRTSAGDVVCGAPDSICLSERRRDVMCSTPGGGIILDRNGVAQCGPGYCVTDQRGQTWCSSAARGGAATDSNGQAHCTDGCVRGDNAACVRPRPAPR